jgi:hypothetical protein
MIIFEVGRKQPQAAARAIASHNTTDVLQE